mmetsp:Transcript_15771/g.33708  ORF Transcript_15771/g.33708 Transcript_15771/m.33708 type:complete len:219 (-) Transcript_15771:669-1325(-)
MPFVILQTMFCSQSSQGATLKAHLARTLGSTTLASSRRRCLPTGLQRLSAKAPTPSTRSSLIQLLPCRISSGSPRSLRTTSRGSSCMAPTCTPVESSSPLTCFVRFKARRARCFSTGTHLSCAPKRHLELRASSVPCSSNGIAASASRRSRPVVTNLTALAAPRVRLTLPSLMIWSAHLDLYAQTGDTARPPSSGAHRRSSTTLEKTRRCLSPFLTST